MKIVRISNKKDMFKLADSAGEETWFHLKEGKVRDFAIKKYKIGDELGELGTDIKVTGEKKNDQTITFIGSNNETANTTETPNSTDNSSVETTNDTTTYTMPFGKHKGQVLKTIPDDYLTWLMEKAEIRGKLKDEVEKEINKRKENDELKVS